eukprot:GHVR01024536.1.p1 GENE.GHVR01024536.1~~GHVR01024536.1.p1  ORF type:complete len:444 (+),score=103.55 GHVR01024536.1:23-1333(+)
MLRAHNIAKTLGQQLRSTIGSQRRCLDLHEYQSMTIMSEFGVAVPRFQAVFSPREAEYACSKLGDVDYVVKAQVLTGGRGLGYFKENDFEGGVHICSTPEAVKSTVRKMIGNTLVTKQTGEAGKPCNCVLIAERFYLRREKYFAIMLDRESLGPVLIGSQYGGMNIEDVAAKRPQSIVKMKVDVGAKDLSAAQAREFAEKLGFEGEQLDMAAQNIQALYKMFNERDCTLIEVNPFAETHDGRAIVCDAKVNYDDNASYRQEALFSLRDVSQEDPREVHASRFDLNYVGLEGSIGCMVNGAGLALSTMDIIKLHGGSPANFLDVGGGASKEQVVEALRILQQDPHVKSILVNIFGGIMRCDTIALGMIAASQQVGLSKPLVVRLQGTKQREAAKLIDESGLRMLAIGDLDQAAKKAVKMAEIMDIATHAGLNVEFEM